MIEVGPGTGNLTRHLLAQKARVLAVEKDDTLIKRLRDEFKQVGTGLQHLRWQLHSHQPADTHQHCCGWLWRVLCAGRGSCTQYVWHVLLYVT